MKVDEIKQTQGQRKTSQRLRELFQNEAFQKELKKIKAIDDKDKQFRAIFSLARDNSLSFEPGSALFHLYTDERDIKDFLIDNFYNDVCQVYDEVDEYLNSAFPIDYEIPPSKKPSKKLELYAYPVHIGLSTKSTKRDVLDYISKRWDYIRNMLDQYEEKPKGIRKKRKLKRDTFIWNNRNLPAKKLADEVNKKFPEETLTYADINSILYYLRKRNTQF